MKITIDIASNWEDYKKAWIKSMENIHWFKENKLFDYNREEELEALQRVFKLGSDNNVFMIARKQIIVRLNKSK